MKSIRRPRNNSAKHISRPRKEKIRKILGRSNVYCSMRIRTGTAFQMHNRDRQGAQPWLYSSVVDRISKSTEIVIRDTRISASYLLDILTGFNNIRHEIRDQNDTKAREKASHGNLNSWPWCRAVGLNHFLRYKSYTAVPTLRRLRTKE